MLNVTNAESLELFETFKFIGFNGSKKVKSRATLTLFPYFIDCIIWL